MAPSVISRATWTDDDGSLTTGTIIGNTRLQADIYDKIDAMFAGSGSYSTLSLGGNVRAEGTKGLGHKGAASGSLAVSAAGDGNVLYDTTLGALVQSLNGGILTRLSPQAIEIGQAEGTDTATTTTNLATIAMGTTVLNTLTVKDSLLVDLTLSALTGNANMPFIYNGTDSVTAALINPGSTLSAGEFLRAFLMIGPDQSAATKILSLSIYGTGAASAAGAVYMTHSTFTTAWTGAWNWVLRYAGMASGTMRYRAKVYKIAGQ